MYRTLNKCVFLLFFPVFRVLVSLRFSRGSQKWARAELVWHYGAAWLGPLMNTREACVSMKCRPLQSGIQATGSSQRDEWLWNHTGGEKKAMYLAGWERRGVSQEQKCYSTLLSSPRSSVPITSMADQRGRVWIYYVFDGVFASAAVHVK